MDGGSIDPEAALNSAPHPSKKRVRTGESSKAILHDCENAIMFVDGTSTGL